MSGSTIRSFISKKKHISLHSYTALHIPATPSCRLVLRQLADPPALHAKAPPEIDFKHSTQATPNRSNSIQSPAPSPLPPSPVSTTTMSILQTHGVVVYQLLTAEETVAHRAAVLSAVKAAPELINPAPTATTQSLGAFGALGTPSSQNNVAVRNLRKLAHARTVRSVWRACAGGRNLEQLVDRLCVRTQKQPKE